MAEGHAGTKAAGRNIACAAATVLLRTAGGACAGHGIMEAGGAAAPGAMNLEVLPAAPADGAWLRGVTDFLLRGLKDLQDEFPRDIALRVETTEV
jgi:uncharacterized protein YsxB (DUF464 family)